MTSRSVLLLAALVLAASNSNSNLLRASGMAQALAGDAYIDYDEGKGAWVLGNSTMRYGVTRNPSAGLVVSQLAGADGIGWTVDESADAGFTVNGRGTILGTAQAPYVDFLTDVVGGGVHLSLVFNVANESLRVTRHYVVYPGAPAVETWLEFTATGGASPTVGDLVVWRQGIPATDARWINGLQAPAAEGGTFARRHQPMTAGQRVDLFADGRSSSDSVPLVWLEGAQGQFVGGVMWSGAWSIAAIRQGRVTQTSLALGSLSTSVAPGQPFETPHVFVGVTPGGLAESSAGLRVFVERGVRQGRPFEERVTYNTWFAYGVDVNEEPMREEIRQAADSGAELFVLDAGWYQGMTNASDDFSAGLGSWQADAAKFPSGLRALADHTRELGLNFGIWVEPERVAMTTVNQPGLARERWLATTDGRYIPPLANGAISAAQVCLADPGARQWVLEQLFALIDDVQPDYLKWDNNLWVNCNRAGHGHGSRDGNFAHVRALYEVLATLRARYPYLRIENCSGGGNRLDFGMLRLTDVAWMDDQSAPSSRVRGHLEGLSLAFPAPYLFSFVMSDGTEDMHGHPDLPLLFRSRMPGLLGLTYVASEFGEQDLDQMRQEIARYKLLRGRLRDATSILLTGQIREGQAYEWDVIQTVSEGSGDVLLFAYQGASAGESVHVWLQRLDPTATYEIESVDTGSLGTASGAQLLEDGLEIEASPVSRAQILLLTKAGVDPTETESKRRPGR